MQYVRVAVTRFLIAAGLCLVSIFFIDGPVARLFSNSVLYHDHQKYAVGSVLLLMPLALIAALLMIWQRRRFHGARHAVILAAISAIIALVSNNTLLKPIFGRTSIDEFLYWPSHYGFYFLKGGWKSNFPSGHMALVVAAITIGWREFPRLRSIFAVTVVVAAFLLLFGEWHFVSDLIAGAIWGNLIALATFSWFEKLQPVAPRSPGDNPG